MKFKIGDRVTTLVTINNAKKGSSGVIRRLYVDRGGIYAIEFDDSILNNFKHIDYPDTFEQLYGDDDLKSRVIYTKLAEKMYPKGKRDGKYWNLQ